MERGDDRPEKPQRLCCDKPLIEMRSYPTGATTATNDGIVTPMATEWSCLSCGARGISWN